MQHPGSERPRWSCQTLIATAAAVQPAAPTKSRPGWPWSISQPKTGGPKTPPIEKPVLTMPKTAPACPGGAAARTSMSRDGMMSPERKPAPPITSARPTPPIGTMPASRMRTPEAARPQAATSPCRRVRSATWPPASTPMALIASQAVSAVLPAAIVTPSSAIQAGTPKLCTAPEPRLSRMKKPVSASTAGLSRAGAPAARGRRGASRSAAAWRSNGSAASGPSSPARMSAPRSPRAQAASSISPGASALPA